MPSVKFFCSISLSGPAKPPTRYTKEASHFCFFYSNDRMEPSVVKDFIMDEFKNNDLMKFNREEINFLLKRKVRLENKNGDTYQGKVSRLECSCGEQILPSNIVLAEKRICINDIQTIKIKD